MCTYRECALLTCIKYDHTGKCMKGVGTKDPKTKDPKDKRPNWQKTQKTKDPPGQKTQLTKDPKTKDPKTKDPQDKRPTKTKDPKDKRPTAQKTQFPRKKDPILPAEFRSKLKIRQQKNRKSAKNYEKITQFLKIFILCGSVSSQGVGLVGKSEVSGIFMIYNYNPYFYYTNCILHIVHNSILLTYTWTNVCLISMLCIKKYMPRNW